MRYSVRRANRSHLFTCAVCGKKNLCGCCSIRSRANGKRMYCYPGTNNTCVIVSHGEMTNRENARNQTCGGERDLTPQMGG